MKKLFLAIWLVGGMVLDSGCGAGGGMGGGGCAGGSCGGGGAFKMAGAPSASSCPGGICSSGGGNCPGGVCSPGGSSGGGISSNFKLGSTPGSSFLGLPPGDQSW